jgi:N-hydroxyarylamine O-acetyltransferase
LNLAAYLERVEFSGEPRADIATLEALHLAHATHIPFENLDVLLKLPICLDLDSLFTKLVTRRRGGYCFEQNLLFAEVLNQIGFSFSQLAARVRYRSHRIQARTHMLLLVHIADSQWLADVGFGGEGLLLPVPFGTSQPAKQYAWTYRIVQLDKLWVLQTLHSESWHDLYAFDLEPQYLVDYQMANHFTSTHPDSRFVNTLTVQLPLPDGRRILINREFSIDRGDAGNEQRTITDAELPLILDDTFGIILPEGQRLPTLPMG